MKVFGDVGDRVGPRSQIDSTTERQRQQTCKVHPIDAVDVTVCVGLVCELQPLSLWPPFALSFAHL